MKIYSFIFVLFNTITLASFQEKCPTGEIYKTCGTACPATCKKSSPTICTDNCVTGCFCAENKVRDENTGKCVDLKSCTCPKGETFNECGTACPPTCTKPSPTICTLQCVAGCFCTNNTVRDENTGKCVDLKACTCPKGEEFNECGTACPATCTNPSPTVCTKNCVGGCFCTNNTVRDENTGKCVALKSCTCPNDEEFDECGTACPLTCENPKPRPCTKQCKLGCFCKKDKVRQESTGECVDPKDCINCRENEEYTRSCVSAATCEHPHLKTCCQRCGCTCKRGLVRDVEIDECVPIEECPQTEPSGCKDGEVYKECGPGCLATCSNPQPPNCTEPCKKGCFCPPGQLRNDFDDYKCINKSACPIID